MKTKMFIVALSTCAMISYGQSSSTETARFAGVDKKALELPEAMTGAPSEIARYISSNFENDAERLRAAFIWVASNIEYDVANMYAINFNEPRDERIEKILRTRKGVCAGYSALFNDICKELGFEVREIEGYTKQNGIQSYIPHSWNAVLCDDGWYVFDPTWGAGYYDNGRFVRKINNAYFKAAPADAIKSHMPFDYLFQFLHYPVNNGEFARGETKQNDTKPYFNYPDSLALFDRLDAMERLTASAYRVEKNGVSNAMIFEKLKSVKLEIENMQENETVALYNSAVEYSNHAVGYMNKYLTYWNKQFQPLVPDNEIQAMLDAVTGKLSEAREKLSQIRYPRGREAIIKDFEGQIDDKMEGAAKQQEWLDEYFSKKKAGRKAMFHKYYWFGIPLN